MTDLIARLRILSSKWLIGDGGQTCAEAAAELERLQASERRLREALKELLNLCAIGDVDESTEAHGWGAAIKEARAALEQLSAADLKRIGVSIKDDDDQVVVRDTESEIDKLVSALLAHDKSLDA